MKKYISYSDPHFNFTFPWTQYNFVETVQNEHPHGLFLHGDIACGISLVPILTFLAKQLRDINIYFVIGNHDHYSYSLARATEVLHKLTAKYHNLIWLTQQDIISLNKNVALIGEDGWYDARLGDPVYLNYNLDWIMIEDFRKLKSFQAKLDLSRQLADQYTANLQSKLEKALASFETVHIITHVPGWKEATRGLGSLAEKFWLPYNINYHMGLMIEEVMSAHEHQNVIVHSGHTHVATHINVAHNIECIVQQGKYLGPPSAHDTIFI